MAVAWMESGTLALYEHAMRIKRKNQSKDILLSPVSSVLLRRPGCCVPGCLRLTFPGSQESASFADENTVTFKRGQLKDFERFKDELDRRVLAARTAGR